MFDRQPFVLAAPPLLEWKPGIFSSKNNTVSAAISSGATFAPRMMLN